MLKNKYTFLLALTSLFSIATFAQTTIATTKPESATNYLLWLMITVAILLVLVVWILAKVLMMVSAKAVELSKLGSKVMMIFVVVMGSLFSKNLMAQTATPNITDTATKASVTSFYGGLSYNTFWTMTSVILLELLVDLCWQRPLLVCGLVILPQLS